MMQNNHNTVFQNFVLFLESIIHIVSEIAPQYLFYRALVGFLRSILRYLNTPLKRLG